jgi:ADP-ribose pyrophosphatase YjhB (NUDIX family)
MLPRDIYRSFYSSMPVACVDLLVMHDGQVLLVRRANEPAAGAWWLPGGRIQYRERRRDAAIRKLHEETGFTAREITELLTDDLIFDQKVDAPLHGVTSVFACNIAAATEPRLDEQSLEARWLTADEWMLHELHPFVRRMVALSRSLSGADSRTDRCPRL